MLHQLKSQPKSRATDPQPFGGWFHPAPVFKQTQVHKPFLKARTSPTTHTQTHTPDVTAGKPWSADRAGKAWHLLSRSHPEERGRRQERPKDNLSMRVRQRPIFKRGCCWNLCHWRRPQTQTKTTTFCFDWGRALVMHSGVIKRWTAQGLNRYTRVSVGNPAVRRNNTRLAGYWR